MKAKIFITSMFSNAAGLFVMAVTGLLLKPIEGSGYSWLGVLLALFVSSLITASMFITVINSFKKSSTVDEKECK